MNADLPRDPTADPDLERLIASLDRAAERAGGAAPEPSDHARGAVSEPDDRAQPEDDALVTAILTQLRSPDTWDGPPDHLRAAILAEAAAGTSVHTSTVSSTSPGGGVSPSGIPRPTRPVEPVTELVPRWRRMAWAVPMTAAAAVVFTLLVLGGERLLTAPENGVTYALAGGPQAQNASGTASVGAAAAGFPVVLDVHDLPGAPAGYYYEAWLTKPGQEQNPVSLGTFHGRKSGGPIKLWSGVDPVGYTLNIDLESLTDGPGPSGQVFLTAKIG